MHCHDIICVQLEKRGFFSPTFSQQPTLPLPRKLTAVNHVLFFQTAYKMTARRCVVAGPVSSKSNVYHWSSEGGKGIFMIAVVYFHQKMLLLIFHNIFLTTLLQFSQRTYGIFISFKAFFLAYFWNLCIKLFYLLPQSKSMFKIFLVLISDGPMLLCWCGPKTQQLTHSLHELLKIRPSGLKYSEKLWLVALVKAYLFFLLVMI